MRATCVIRYLFPVFFLFVGTATGQISVSEAASVQLSASVQASPARVTLSWTSFPGATGYTVHRKAHSASSWGSAIGTTAGNVNTFQDNTVAVGTLYEYRVMRTAPPGTGYGYVCSGIELPPVASMGRIVLLVDAAIAPGIGPQLTQLQSDLKADGWVVTRHDVAPGTSVPAVRNLVIGTYNTDPANTKAVYIIGHVPVPYSGNIAPDGHTEQHMGAWPCDAYYGEMNGTWTDNTVNNPSGWSWVRNIPGDGKFDQDSPPNTVELQVGRVDMNDLPAFGQSQTQLLAAYLDKAHQFRTKGFTPQVRGIMRDMMEDLTTPMAGSGWMSMSALVTPGNITEVGYSDPAWLEDLVNGQSYLWTYGSGGGLIENDNGTLMFNQAIKVMTTTGLASKAWDGVFNMSYSSYTGDWNNRNNVLRAVIASGHALTTVYAGPPNWWFHPMGMGLTTGHCTRLTMNNTSTYLPQSGGDINPAPRGALALLGDPALRMMNLAMPANLVVTNNGGNASFNWTAASGSPAGYHIFRFGSDGLPVQVNTTLITGTSFNSTQPFVSGAEYMVRAAKLETTASGSWWNLSLGAQATAPTGANVLANVAMLLEGPYDPFSGMMNDQLRVAGLIPLTEPYTALGLSQAAGGGGETTTPAVLNVTGSNAVVDWVRVELRASGSPGTIVATRQGLVQRDGDVTAVDGISALSFNAAPGNYHVAVRHRNHLGAMTASPVALSGTATPLNFKIPGLGTWGTNAQKLIGGARVLWAGDATSNGQVKYTGAGNDRDPILTIVGSNSPNGIVNGYSTRDVNLNGQVKYTGSGNDRDPILLNVGSASPNATRIGQLP